MWSAFITGFANKSTELIEEKDNEIKKNMELQLKDMYASRKEAMSKAETRRDELRKAAAQLRTFGLDDNGIVEVLSSGNYENITKLLQNEAKTGTLTQQKINRFIGRSESKMPADLEGFFNKATELAAPMGTKPLSTEATGAFGFRSRAAEDTTERFLKAQNLSREDIQKSTLADMPMTGRAFDYSALAGDEDDSFGKVKNRARIKLLEAAEGSEEQKQAMMEYQKIIAIEKLGEDDETAGLAKIKKEAQVDLFNAKTPAERSNALARLTRVISIEDIGKDKKDELKESDVRSNLRILETSIVQSMAGPGNTIVVTDPTTGERRVTIKGTVKPELRNRIEQTRTSAIREYVQTHYTRNGKVPEQVQRVLGAFTVGGMGMEESAEGQPTAAPAPAAGNTGATRGAPARALSQPAATGKVTVTVGNRTIEFPNQEAADKFKREAGIR
jgi:hypothetical protein